MGECNTVPLVKQGVVSLIINKLGWDTFDPLRVLTDFAVDGKRVDYALAFDEPMVFIDVKRSGALGGKDDLKLMDAAVSNNAAFLVVTDGGYWDFYLTKPSASEYSDRCFAHINLINDAYDKSANVLQKFLSRTSLADGSSARAAEEAHQAIVAKEMSRTQIVNAWETLTSNPVNDLLVELVSEEVERLGYQRPDIEDVSAFFSEHLVQIREAALLENSSNAKTNGVASSKRKRKDSWRLKKVILFGESLEFDSFNDAYCTVIQRLAERSPLFCEKLAAHPEAYSRDSRRFLSLKQDEVTLGKDYRNTVQMPNGYWLLVHGSIENKCVRLWLACHVAGIRWNQDLVLEFYDRDGESANTAFLNRLANKRPSQIT